MSTKPFQISAQNLGGGYHSRTLGLKPEQLAPPSQNVRLTLLGQAASRLGYKNTTWTLGQAGFAAYPFYMSRYNITFFAINTKIYYVDHNRSNAVVDTGFTQTAATTTRFEDYVGNLYCINTTDGVKKAVVSTLAAAASAGAATITLEQGQTNRFAGTGTVRINGTNETYTGVSGDTLTGMNLTQSYAIGDIVIETSSFGSIPKGSKLTFWYERMTIMGVGTNATAKAGKNTVFFSKFTTSNALANIEDFTFGAGGSNYSIAGKNGVITNIVPVRDYLYLFNETETYYITRSSVSTSDGTSPAQIFSPIYGCANTECAVEMDGQIVWLTNNKRIVRSNIRVELGTASLYPDATFDQPIHEDLLMIDDDQSSAHMVYYKKAKLLFVQVRVKGKYLTYIFDNNLGVWLPPDTNKLFKKYFQIKSDLYATDYADQTIYQVETTNSDNGGLIDTIIASGSLVYDQRTTVDWDEIRLKGKISLLTRVTYTPIVDDQEGASKSITNADATGPTADTHEVGAELVGEGSVGSSSVAVPSRLFRKRMKVYPSKGFEIQHKFRANQDGQFFQLDNWTTVAKVFSTPLVTAN